MHLPACGGPRALPSPLLLLPLLPSWRFGGSSSSPLLLGAVLCYQLLQCSRGSSICQGVTAKSGNITRWKNSNQPQPRRRRFPNRLTWARPEFTPADLKREDAKMRNPRKQEPEQRPGLPEVRPARTDGRETPASCVTYPTSYTVRPDAPGRMRLSQLLFEIGCPERGMHPLDISLRKAILLKQNMRDGTQDDTLPSRRRNLL